MWLAMAHAYAYGAKITITGEGDINVSVPAGMLSRAESFRHHDTWPKFPIVSHCLAIPTLAEL